MSLHLARRRVVELQELGLADESIQLVLNRVGARRSVKSEDAAQAVGVSGGAQSQPRPPDRSAGAQHYGSSRDPGGPGLLAAGELSFRLNETGEPVLGA